MTGIEFQEAHANLRQEFIESSGERMDRIDTLIDTMYHGAGDRCADLAEFQRDIHSLKGTAGTFGFDSVMLIAHRLEDFVESAPVLNNGQLLDVQIYVDRIREILESGRNVGEGCLDKILQSLPSNVATPAISQE